MDEQTKLEQDVLIFRLFCNPDGEKLLGMLTQRFYDIQSHTPGDAYETAFKEGQRSVLSYILKGIASAKTPDEASKDFEIED